MGSAVDVQAPGAERRVFWTAAAVTVVPRLLARRGGELPPLGPEYWQDTTVEIPAEAGRRFRNVLTGEDLDGGALPVGHALAHVPVALLDSGAA